MFGYLLFFGYFCTQFGSLSSYSYTLLYINEMMKLIADSGSTKTEWALMRGNGEVIASCLTDGLNPYHLGDGEILQVLQVQLKKSIVAASAVDFSFPDDITEVYFYGSGVTEAMKPKMTSLLSQAFPQAEIQAESDLLGAARALFGHESGIACILGTGSNSCYYDGERILMNTPPLGYVLGDEGSGTDLGKHLLNAIFKGLLPPVVKDHFLAWSGLDYPTIINKVYRQPLANRFLASLTRFISHEMSMTEKAKTDTQEHDVHVGLDMMVQECFGNFCLRNLSAYLAAHEDDEEGLVPVGFVGSIAHYFQSQLDAVCCEFPLRIVKVMKAPMAGLLEYHAGK